MSNGELMNARAVIVLLNASSTNKYLALGWKLITTASGQDEEGYPITKYSLGWFGQGDPVHVEIY
jgi:hypothetical protein